ncbi:glycine reductase [Paralimibaculum aggregatum]|nr:glycine reductase [Limibaculum sp. NKW23]
MSGEPIRYIERTRSYYAALGYGAPYRWARFETVPFLPVGRPLAACRIGLVTTAAPVKPGAGDQGPGAAYNAKAKFYKVYSGPADGPLPDLRISHLAIDRDHTTAEDLGSYFPLAALRRAAAAGRIGAVGPRFHGLPTNRSQATTMEVDCPELLARCREDRLDAVLLVANCPVCHQSTALAARALEAGGIPAAVLGCARDIVEIVGVSRFVFSDFPLGNAAGPPHDPAGQDATLALALGLLETATGPRSTVASPLRWPGDPGWKRDYCNIERLSAEEIAARRAAFDAGKREAKRLREETPPA